MKKTNAIGLAIFLASLPAAALAEAPSTGFYIDARLTSLNLPGFDAGALGAPAPASLGYRGDGYTLGIAPAFHRLGVSNTACTVNPTIGECAGDDTDSESVGVNIIGAQLLGTYALARLDEDRAEIYALGGLLIGTAFLTGDDEGAGDADSLGSPIAWGVTAGAGIRYFLTSHLALGAEIGEGYASLPLGSSPTSAQRAGAFTTWGALAAQLVF